MKASLFGESVPLKLKVAIFGMFGLLLLDLSLCLSFSCSVLALTGRLWNSRISIFRWLLGLSLRLPQPCPTHAGKCVFRCAASPLPDEDKLDQYRCCFLLLDDVLWLGAATEAIDPTVVLTAKGTVGAEFTSLTLGINDARMRSSETWVHHSVNLSPCSW